MKNKAPVIDVYNLSKSFGGKIAVREFSLQVKQGEICGFLGPNGSGKTTILRMLCGLLTPDSGYGNCLGFSILQESYKIKQQVGYMTQNFSLYHDLTTYENLDLVARIYGIGNRKKSIEESMKSFNLIDCRNKLAGELSGGWKQRLALAGCMLRKPRLLLLDEPTGGVDPKARGEFWDKIFLLSEQGITTLVSTHYMDEAERCTKLAYVAYGNLLVEGTSSQIIEKSGLTTWQVTGDKLMSIANELKKIPSVDQVTFFGNKLHISGRNKNLLEKDIQAIKNEQWKEIPTGLEDAFISFVNKFSVNQ